MRFCSLLFCYSLSFSALLFLPPLRPFLLCYALFSATLSRQMLADAASGCITSFRSVSLHFLTTRKQEVINFGVGRGGGGGGMEMEHWRVATTTHHMCCCAASGCITSFRSVSLHFLTTRKQEVINFGVGRWGGGMEMEHWRVAPQLRITELCPFQPFLFPSCPEVQWYMGDVCAMM